jgi:hypothetical protein
MISDPEDVCLACWAYLTQASESAPAESDNWRQRRLAGENIPIERSEFSGDTCARCEQYCNGVPNYLDSLARNPLVRFGLGMLIYQVFKGAFNVSVPDGKDRHQDEATDGGGSSYLVRGQPDHDGPALRLGAPTEGTRADRGHK